MCEESLKLVQSHACDEEPLQESNPVLSLVLGDFVGFVLGIFGITQFLCEMICHYWFILLSQIMLIYISITENLVLSLFSTTL